MYNVHPTVQLKSIIYSSDTISAIPAALKPLQAISGCSDMYKYRSLIHCAPKGFIVLSGNLIGTVVP